MTPEEIGALMAGVTQATANNKKSDTTALHVSGTKSEVTIGFFNIFTENEAEIASVVKALAKAGMSANIYDPNLRKEAPGFGL
jgi:ribonuclease HI